MSLNKKVRQVKEVFRLLDEDVERFKQGTGLQCREKCSRCCVYPDIEGTILEFIPLAHALYKAGQAGDWLQELGQLGEERGCMLLSLQGANGSWGLCRKYKYRGLVCRLFGFSAVLDKHGQPSLVTCEAIKQAKPGYREISEMYRLNGGYIPIMNYYYYRLYAIDIYLSNQRYRVNEAIKRALETVTAYYVYRRPQSSGYPSNAGPDVH
jgi:Fe-S-cluster containining protein